MNVINVFDKLIRIIIYKTKFGDQVPPDWITIDLGFKFGCY